MVNKEKLFIYGTLADSDIQRNVWGRVTKGISAVLRGYRKSEIKIDGTKYPIIIPDKTDKVEGVIIVLTRYELEKTDEYETDVYKRTQVCLDDGTLVWVYVKG